MSVLLEHSYAKPKNSSIAVDNRKNTTEYLRSKILNIDFESIIMGEKLSDIEINVAQQMLRIQFATINGLDLPLCIDTTRYRDTKQYRSTSSFGIVGIDYATYNQTGDDFGSHFQLRISWVSINVIKFATSYTKCEKAKFYTHISLVISCRPYHVKCQYLKYIVIP